MGQALLRNRIFFTSSANVAYTGAYNWNKSNVLEITGSGTLTLDGQADATVLLIGGGTGGESDSANSFQSGSPGATSLSFGTTRITASGGDSNENEAGKKTGVTARALGGSSGAGRNGGDAVEQELTIPANTDITIMVGAGAPPKRPSCGNHLGNEYQGAVYIIFK